MEIERFRSEANYVIQNLITLTLMCRINEHLFKYLKLLLTLLPFSV